MGGANALVVDVPKHANLDIEIIPIFLKDLEILPIKRRAFLWRYPKYKVPGFVPTANYSGELDMGLFEHVCASH
jgi:hypothetical protein